MPRGSPLVAFFVVALALKKIALQIRFFSVLLMPTNRKYAAIETPYGPAPTMQTIGWRVAFTMVSRVINLQ